MLLSILRTILRRSPDSTASADAPAIEALLQQGLDLQSRGELLEAERVFRQAVRKDPQRAEALHLLGILLHRMQRTPDALTALRQAVTIAPDDPVIHLHLGVTLQSISMLPEAVACFEQVLRLDPGQAGAFVNLGTAQRELGNLDAAQNAFLQAVQIDPGVAGAWHNLGNLQWDHGDASGAINSFERALSIDSNFLDARFSRGLALLGTGDFARGWDDYDARLSLPRWNRDLPELTFPRWLGEPLKDCTVLVWGEQGLGDEIMFASCFPDLLEQAGDCIIACAPRLRDLFQRSFKSATVLGTDEIAAGLARRSVPVDYQIWSGSLPKVWRRDLSAFPHHHDYLKADPERVAAWRAKLSALGSGLKVGVSWKGGTPQTGGADRSMALDVLRPLLTTRGCQFVDLQYGDVTEERAAFRAQSGCLLHHWQEAIDDLDECAALLSALDLIVTVGSSTAHLAGALGRPVWIMVPYSADWRYMREGTRMVWHPSAHIVRQARSGDWVEVVERVRHQLAVRPATSTDQLGGFAAR